MPAAKEEVFLVVMSHVDNAKSKRDRTNTPSYAYDGASSL